MLTPRASRQSAAPLLLDAALFPCFATLIPAAAITKEEVVEMLKVPAISPPVPTMSIAERKPFITAALLLIPFAKPVISSMVSPFILIAIRNADI